MGATRLFVLFIAIATIGCLREINEGRPKTFVVRSAGRVVDVHMVGEASLLGPSSGQALTKVMKAVDERYKATYSVRRVVMSFRPDSPLPVIDGGLAQYFCLGGACTLKSSSAQRHSSRVVGDADPHDWSSFRPNLRLRGFTLHGDDSRDQFIDFLFDSQSALALEVSKAVFIKLRLLTAIDNLRLWINVPPSGAEPGPQWNIPHFTMGPAGGVLCYESNQEFRCREN